MRPLWVPEVRNVAWGSEQAVLRFMGKVRTMDNDAVTSIERSSFALLDFLRRRLSGKELSPLALFPQYREVQTLAGADRIHPADLWQAMDAGLDPTADPDVRKGDSGDTMRSANQSEQSSRRK